ncbi:MAG: hypothetical protein ACYCWW_06230 [Deltaproteobacteria bacterium]
MRRLVPLAAILFAHALACRCAARSPDAGADSGSSSLPNPALSPTAACEQLSGALAALEVRCGRLAAADEAVYAASLCAGATARAQQAYDAGLLAYSAVAVACEVKFRGSQPCNLSPSTQSGCAPLAWGNLVEGDQCDDPSSCGQTLFCERVSGSSPCGICTADPGLGGPCGPSAYGAPCQQGLCDGTTCDEVAGEGQPCFLTASVCSAGLTCQQSVCLPPAEDGGVCTSTEDCADGLYCESGICSTRGGVGAACASAACAFGLGCGLTDGGTACEPLDAGGACVIGPDGGSCLEAEWCGSDGGCLRMPSLGQPCSGGEPCLDGACVGGSCQLLGAGQPCAGGLACDNGRCGGDGIVPVCEPDCLNQ